MLASYNTGIPIQIPAGEGEEGAEVGFVPNPVEVGFGEVADGVDSVNHHNENAHGEHKGGVEDEFVEIANA